MRKYISFLVIAFALVVAVFASEPLVLVHGLGEEQTTLNGIENVLEHDGYSFSKIVKIPFSSDQKIEKMANIMNNFLTSQNVNRQSIVITHSMGGLVARQYMLDEMNNSKVRVLITIALPNTGASISDPKHWLPFAAFDCLAIITPVVVDIYWQKPKIIASISSPVTTIGTWMVNFVKIR